MFFPHFTNQEITIDGTWQGDDRQLRFTGTLSSSEPFVMLSLLKYGNEYHYTKHNKSNTLETPLNLYQSKFPQDNRCQPVLMIGNSVNTGAVSDGRLFLSEKLPMTFQTGHLFAFSMDFQNRPFICITSPQFGHD
jgi:hypothetical protein